MVDFDELKKLRPKDRIEKLKEFETQINEELEQAKKMRDQSETELKREEIMTHATAPEQESVDIADLFSSEDSIDGQVSGTNLGEQINQDYQSLKGLSEYENLTPDQQDAVNQIEERINAAKYMQTSKANSEKLVASRTVLYNMKKYSMG